MRNEIFALRKDPTANSLMAGAFANSSAEVLTDRLGRKPTDGELYMAHFLGASGAARFIRAAEANPNAKAASLFPRAAHANSSIFYDESGAARSLKQVYAGLVSRHDVLGGVTQLAAAKPTDAVAKSTQPAVTTPAPVPAAPPLIQTANDAPLTPRMVKTIAITPTAPAATVATAAAVTPPTANAAPVSPENAATFAERVAAVDTTAAANEAPRAPMFQTLFSPDQRGALAPVVRELWGVRHAAAAETAAAVAPATDISAQRRTGPALNAPLDLFQFMRPNARRPA